MVRVPDTECMEVTSRIEERVKAYEASARELLDLRRMRGRGGRIAIQLRSASGHIVIAKYRATDDDLNHMERGLERQTDDLYDRIHKIMSEMPYKYRFDQPAQEGVDQET